MNTTKNVKYAAFKEDLFNAVCEAQYKKNMAKIREIFDHMKAKTEKVTGYNIPVKSIDGKENLCLNLKFKTLFHDKSKMKQIGHMQDFMFYNEEVEWYKNLDDNERDKVNEWYKDNNYALPLPFEETIAGHEAFRPTRTDLVDLYYDVSLSIWYAASDEYFIDEYGQAFRPNGGFNYNNCNVLPYRISVHRYEYSGTLFEICLRLGVYPTELEAMADNFRSLHNLCKEGLNIENLSNLEELISKGQSSELFGMPIDMNDIKTYVLGNSIDISDENDFAGMTIRKYLDNCDYYRAEIQPYSSRWYLTDESQGHWELWGNKDENDLRSNKDINITKTVTLEFTNGVIARNPIADVKHNSVVGIDFGTKSTIVAVQNENDEIIPMRVGMADYSLESADKHYENPTVMQFCDISSFIKKYNSCVGRPYTSWSDLKISHQAFSNMINASKSKRLLSFVYDLKQWAGGSKNNRMIIKDEKGIRLDLDSYLELKSDDIDPIELYAYYLGLFINNMHTGIYLDYIMSFPETYQIEVRKAIINSFTRGLRKSIPEVVINDEKCGKEFRVREGQSEPAAYAVCALDAYGIYADEEGIPYCVFDFGGGTTDFDYGLWKAAPEDEYTYNDILTHCSSGGDRTLGGENILQLMAYSVFTDKDNQKIMRENKLVFCRPEDGKILTGMEALMKNDECAMLNTKQLMEVLRPLWEKEIKIPESGSENIIIEYDSNSYLELNEDGTALAAVNLFSESGEERTQVFLRVYPSELEELINKRIETGVSSFFEGLRNVYEKNDWKTKKPIHVFLAGNSSKSKRVSKLFKKYAKKYDPVIFGSGTEKKSESADSVEKNFIIYPPLGTEEADAIQEAKGISMESDKMKNPTGKTGVAFGLVMSREGAGILVESESGRNIQIKTNYYIGVNYRRKFKMILDRTNEYGVWKKFIKSVPDAETFEFYYTQLPEVVLNSDTDIKGNPAIKRCKCIIDKNAPGAFIFFRFTAPEHLEYVVAMEDEIDKDKFISSVYSVDL